jgi:hypothetical protein
MKNDNLILIFLITIYLFVYNWIELIGAIITKGDWILIVLINVIFLTLIIAKIFWDIFKL